jgi:hypothetical protein
MHKEHQKWCEHIHNWDGVFFYIDSFHPFPVLNIGTTDPGEKIQQEWKQCPICLAPSPLKTKGLEKNV